MGYDGAVLTDPDLDDPAANSITYVAFRPEQVKAVANRGTWDPGDPRMSFKRSSATPGDEDEEEAMCSPKF
ncbi:hypothetical protein CSC66_08995 [Pseudoxanthomonas kaohsiungensis]|nr:hypothetical protein CSC66_08995 [Pseudoxanthomonas kaohsiungensis]